MTFEEYVRRQRNSLMRRHTGEEFLVINGEVLPLRPADEILRDMASMEGLVRERAPRAGGVSGRPARQGVGRSFYRRAAAM